MSHSDSKNILDGAAAGGAAASIWMSLSHISIIVALVAGTLSAIWTGIRIFEWWKGGKRPN